MPVAGLDDDIANGEDSEGWDAVLDAYRRSIQESVADAPTISVGKAFARSKQ